MKLFVDAFWISPYSFSAYVALREKNLPFEAVELMLPKADHKAERWRGTLLTEKIPALDDGGFTLAESSAIVEYLEDAYPPPKHARLLPADPKARARARMIMAFVRSDMMPIREERATHTMFYERAKKPLSDAAADAAARLLRFADSLIPDGSPYLFGEWSIAEADLAFMLQRLVMNGHRTSAKIGNFVEVQWARKSVKEFADKVRPPYVAY